MRLSVMLLGGVVLAACVSTSTTNQQTDEVTGKPVIYQMMTRLFGNQNTTNKPWGTIEQNGVGKFADITPLALDELKSLGTTHVWYTGIVHHASMTDYRQFGLFLDDPDVVKGRAGSPYAVRDYYNVDPDLAVDVEARLSEFEALIERTHAAGLKVIMDIVPNHVARKYQSASHPTGVEDFGALDNRQKVYDRDNNFYYIPNQAFQVPQFDAQALPLGGEAHPLADGQFDENPAKWTGNGSRSVQPNKNDWYETVKINYGVKPDGSADFPRLPAHYAQLDVEHHLAFWQGVDVPDSWVKFKQIALYWLDKGVDGFRYDVAEMVPVEFWSYLNSHIKVVNPDTLLLAEIYNPSLYRDYIYLGKMDYLYDKVGTYDALRAVVEGKQSTQDLPELQASLLDIDQYLLRFLENHDEQRIAHPAFAGDSYKALPAMVYSSLVGRNATMIYFGQENGESAQQDLGFGKASRTTIFDYAGVPAHQRWMNEGRFDGGLSTEKERSLRRFYRRLLNLSHQPVFSGEYQSLPMTVSGQPGLTPLWSSFARWDANQQVITMLNFSPMAVRARVTIPQGLVQRWSLHQKPEWILADWLAGVEQGTLNLDHEGQGYIEAVIPAYGSFVWAVQH